MSVAVSLSFTPASPCVLYFVDSTKKDDGSGLDFDCMILSLHASSAPPKRPKRLTHFTSSLGFDQARGLTLHNHRYGSLVPCRWRYLTSRNTSTGLGMWSSPRFITPMGRSGKFFVTSRIGGFLSPPLLVAAALSVQLYPIACWFLSTLPTDTSLSHPPPFKCTIKPRSEKSAALVASVEL